MARRYSPACCGDHAIRRVRRVNPAAKSRSGRLPGLDLELRLMAGPLIALLALVAVGVCSLAAISSLAGAALQLHDGVLLSARVRDFAADLRGVRAALETTRSDEIYRTEFYRYISRQ